MAKLRIKIKIVVLCHSSPHKHCNTNTHTHTNRRREKDTNRYSSVTSSHIWKNKFKRELNIISARTRGWIRWYKWTKLGKNDGNGYKNYEQKIGKRENKNGKINHPQIEKIHIKWWNLSETAAYIHYTPMEHRTKKKRNSVEKLMQKENSNKKKSAQRTSVNEWKMKNFLRFFSFSVEQIRKKTYRKSSKKLLSSWKRTWWNEINVYEMNPSPREGWH